MSSPIQNRGRFPIRPDSVSFEDAFAYWEIEQFDEALDIIYRSALSIDPTDHELQKKFKTLEISCYISLKEKSTALKALSLWLKNDSLQTQYFSEKISDYWGIIRCIKEATKKLAADKLDESIAFAKKGLKATGGDQNDKAWLFAILGVAYYLQEDFQKSFTAASKGLDLAPTNLDVKAILYGNLLVSFRSLKGQKTNDGKLDIQKLKETLRKTNT